MRSGKAGAMLVIAVIALAACGGGEAARVVSIVEEELYREPTAADGAGSTVDIYVADGNEAGPLVVLLHGFGRSGPGMPDVDIGPLAEEIAKLGSTVFYFGWQTGLGYRADSAADLSCVGPFVAARAVEFGADPENIVVVGHSMGAASGSMLAFSSFDLSPSPDCTETGQASSPVAFIGMGGAYGMVGAPLDDDPTTYRVRSWPRGTFQELAAEEEILSGLTASQIYQLDGYRAIPPTDGLEIVLVVGSKDQNSTTNADTTTRFAEALRAENVDVEVVIVEGANHENVVDPTTEAGQATLRAVKNILTNTR